MPCPFCLIAAGAEPSADPEIVKSAIGSAYITLSTSLIVAFLDIAPIKPGHILVCPRDHRSKSSELTIAESAAMGFWLPILARSVMRALYGGVDGSWNIIQANGAEAGQTVAHAHYHIIPRARAQSAEDAAARTKGMTDAERQNIALGEGPRMKLDDAKGARISELIKLEVEKEVKVMEEQGLVLEDPDDGSWNMVRYEGMKFKL